MWLTMYKDAQMKKIYSKVKTLGITQKENAVNRIEKKHIFWNLVYNTVDVSTITY